MLTGPELCVEAGELVCEYLGALGGVVRVSKLWEDVYFFSSKFGKLEIV